MSDLIEKGLRLLSGLRLKPTAELPVNTMALLSTSIL